MRTLLNEANLTLNIEISSKINRINLNQIFLYSNVHVDIVKSLKNKPVKGYEFDARACFMCQTDASAVSGKPPKLFLLFNIISYYHFLVTNQTCTHTNSICGGSGIISSLLTNKSGTTMTNKFRFLASKTKCSIAMLNAANA